MSVSALSATTKGGVVAEVAEEVEEAVLVLSPSFPAAGLSSCKGLASNVGLGGSVGLGSHAGIS